MDVVLTEVMRNRFAAIAAEASYIAYRTAHTTFVKQTQDYQVAMASLDGEFFAFPTKSGVTSPISQNVRPLVDEIGIDQLAEGDIIISNDPYSGGALCTHTMDIHLIRPVFYHGRLIAFAWAFIHASDIGGAVPGSISPTSYEIYQEGVRIRPNFLYRRGELNAQLWTTFADNSRIPDLIWGDLQAMMSGLSLLDARACELCDRYGVDVVLESVRNVLDLAEQKAGDALRTLRDGCYFFNDYLEAYRGEGHIFICAHMTVADGTVTIDFTGSDPQVNYAMNFPSSDRKSHPFLCLPLIHYIQTMEPTIAINGGMVRPIRTYAPRGTIMNATFPAAGGNRAITLNRLYDVILGCINQAVDGGVSAAGSGMAGIISTSAVNPMTGLRHVSVVEPFIGGGGARLGKDGVDGINNPTAFLRSAPIETVELETSLVVRRWSYEQDSPGAGRYRGGCSLRIELENRDVPAIVTVRGLDRFEIEPWGVAGGEPGRLGRVVLNEGMPGEREIGKLEVLEMQPGDVLTMITPSGAGFGLPQDREAEAVLADVLAGVISRATAHDDYGVVITRSEVDAEATKAERAKMKTSVESVATLGPERARLEAKWPPELAAMLSARIMSAPPGSRRYLMDAMRAELNAQPGVVTEATIAEAFVKRGLDGAPASATARGFRLDGETPSGVNALREREQQGA